MMALSQVAATLFTPQPILVTNFFGVEKKTIAAPCQGWNIDMETGSFDKEKVEQMEYVKCELFDCSKQFSQQTHKVKMSVVEMFERTKSDDTVIVKQMCICQTQPLK